MLHAEESEAAGRNVLERRPEEDYLIGTEESLEGIISCVCLVFRGCCCANYNADEKEMIVLYFFNYFAINEGLLGYATGKWEEFEPLVNEHGYFETGDLVRLLNN